MLDNDRMRTNRNLIEFDGPVVRRYPLTAADRADLPAIALRHQAARDLGLPVPRVLAVHEEHLVLERAEGTALVQTQLTDQAQRHLGAELAALLARLRAIQEWPLPSRPWVAVWQRLHEVAGTPQTERAVTTAASITPTLTHGDLSWGNLLVSPEGQLCAVIDWDGATLADPAQDFSAVSANVEPGVARALIEQTPQSDALLERANSYIATWGVQHQLWCEGRHPWVPSPGDG